MDKKALYQLSYGVFMLSTRDGDKVNGCITNTCMQVGSDPAKIAISVLNSNYTCSLISESGFFALSILDKNCSYETIKHFGMQSGRNVDKFENRDLPKDCNGIPYLDKEACAMLSARVIGAIDLITHTLFIAEIVDGKVLHQGEPMTYAYYQSNVKPKPEARIEERKIVGWRCKICGYEYDKPELPDDYSCPLCGHGAEDFEPIYAE